MYRGAIVSFQRLRISRASAGGLIQHSSEEPTGSISHRKGIDRDGRARALGLSPEKLTLGTVMRVPTGWRASGSLLSSGPPAESYTGKRPASNFPTHPAKCRDVARKFQKSCDTRAARASAARPACLLRFNKNRVARQIQNTHVRTPFATVSRIIGKNTGGGGEARDERRRRRGKERKEGRETRSRNTERKTADGRQPLVTKGAQGP